MDKRQIQRFRTRLEIRQQELRVTIEHQLQNARTVEPEPDAVDQAISVSEKESLLQRGKKEQQLLRAVETALGRFRDGSFGQCVSCGNEIGQARLEAVPWTPYCIQCQEAFER
jgi:DnaK suppressor protein